MVSPPFIGVLSYEVFWTADEAMGNLTNAAFIPDVYYSMETT
jgi:hypothetical protein